MPELPPLLVNQTRWSDLLKQLAVLKGLDHVELMAELRACLVLENDRPEHKYLAGEALAWGQYLLAAQGVGIIGYVGLRNPAASGKIVVVERVLGRVDTGAFSSARAMYLGLARAPTVTAQSTEQPRDTRQQPTGAFGTAAPGIVGQVVSARSDTIVVTPFVVSERYAVAFFAAGAGAYAAVAEWPDPAILQPGDVLFIWISDSNGGSASNVALEGSFVWRERTLEPTET